MTDGDIRASESELAHGGVRLHCKSVEPAGPALARLLIVHGYGEHSGRYLHFMRWLAAHGVASTAVDLRGHGRSSGRRGFVRKWEEYLDDTQAFLDTTSRLGNSQIPVPIGAGPCRPGRAEGSSRRWAGGPLFLLGHSHGGLISAAAAERGMLEPPDGPLTTLHGCILSSPYLATRVPPPLPKRVFARAANHVIPWLRVRSGLKPEWLSSDAAMIAEDQADELMNRSATPRWFFTMRQTQTRVRNEAPSFKLPLLCLIGESDVIADPAATADFYDRAGSADKSVYCYPNRVHELLRDLGREQVFADILGWIKART